MIVDTDKVGSGSSFSIGPIATLSLIIAPFSGFDKITVKISSGSNLVCPVNAKSLM